MRTRRIVVTGMGGISALGVTADENWRAAREGRGGIAMQTLDAGPNAPAPHVLPLALAPEGYHKPVEAHAGKAVCDALDPFAAMALAASFEALQQAGLLGHRALDTRTAIVVGHGMGGLGTLEKGFERFYGRKSTRVHPTTVPRVMVSAGASAVAMTFGVHGPVFATSSACSSSAHAIAQGAALIVSGLADVAVTGGSEAIATPGCMRAWEGIHALSAVTCRPFSAGRDGMVMGEGGAVLVLEEHEHARARGAPILGELVGIGMTSDAYHITQPSLEGPAEAVRQACAQAGLLDSKNILISAHGTGTPLNDQNESAVIHQIFKERAKTNPVIATKSAHGHLIGGTAALQGVIGLRALAEGYAPPVLNFSGPDADCDLDLVLGGARAITATHLLLNAFAFGGLDVCLAFAGPHGVAP